MEVLTNNHEITPKSLEIILTNAGKKYILYPLSLISSQDSWVRDLRARLKAWMDRRVSMTSRPALFSYVLKQRQHAKSVGAALVAQESAATAVRSQRTLRRRLQRLQEDYHKLIGVAWELTQGLEAAVRGERVDLEATLAACTHRYPELFTLTLTADTTAKPAAILLESMQRCGRRPGVTASVPALDFERVRVELGAAPETHVLLLLQALRHRITRVSTGSVRQAVVTAYARGDVLGVRGPCRSWSRLAAALTPITPQPSLRRRRPGHQRPHCLRRRQELSVQRGGVPGAPGGAEGGGIRPHHDGHDPRRPAEALHQGRGPVDPDPQRRRRMARVDPREHHQPLALHHGVRDGPAHEPDAEVRREVALCPPRPEPPADAHAPPGLRARACRALCDRGAVQPPVTPGSASGGFSSWAGHIPSASRSERKQRAEATTGVHRRADPSGPPPLPPSLARTPSGYRDTTTIPSPSPSSPPFKEDPEWLEEELDQDDPVRPPPHTPAGEDLLTWRYTLHPGESRLPADPRKEAAPTRSAPVPTVPWDPRGTTPQARPNSDGFVMRRNYNVVGQFRV
nr:uncharacterized protein LOC113813490 [Penaeus vannamei]